MDSSFQVPSSEQFRRWIMALFGFGVAIYFGVKVGAGAAGFVGSIFFVAVLFAILHALKERYWLVFVFGASTVTVPVAFGRAFTSIELCSMLMMAYAALRVVLRVQRFRLFQRSYTPVLLYGVWCALSFSQNPSGLVIWGSDVVGGRWWFDLLLAFGVYFVLANVRVSEGDVKWFVVAAFLREIAAVVVSYRATYLSPLMEQDITLPTYAFTQTLGGLPIVAFFFLLARYPVRELFSLRRAWFVPLFTFLILMSMWSGKRMSIALLLYLPLVAAVVRRQTGFAMLLIAFTGLVIAGLVVGHGRQFVLPRTAQRALSVFPGRWDPEVNIGSSDAFRTIMRTVAYRAIEEKPWFGHGFSIRTSEINVDQRTYGRVTFREDMSTDLAYASGSYHNLWLGMSASLGIPAAVIYAVFLLQALVRSFYLARRTRWGTPYNFLAMYLFLMSFKMLAHSWTGGAGISFAEAWLLALLWPLSAAVAEDMESPSQVVDLTGTVRPMDGDRA